MSLVIECRNAGRGVLMKPGIVPQRGFDLQNLSTRALQKRRADKLMRDRVDSFETQSFSVDKAHSTGGLRT